MSYYRQSGVNTGLIRSINQGLSARVKNGEEYANTRRNNVEFGGAADVAKLFAGCIIPKFRPMFLTFSQAKLTKAIYDLVQSHHENDWGERSIGGQDTPDVISALNALAKVDFLTYYGPLIVEGGSGTNLTNVGVALTADQQNTLAGLGFDGVDFKIASYVIASGHYNGNTGRINKGSYKLIDFINFNDNDLTAAYENADDLPAKETGNIPVTFTPHRIVVAIAMPYKTINSKKYVMQEWCSFLAAETVLGA